MGENTDKPDLQQQKAIDFGQGIAVVKAAAGSGKTRVIERRVSKLLGSGAHPGHILVLSHTNKAADEIRTRTADSKTDDIVVGTFHSLCHRILRQYPKDSGLPKGFTVATPAVSSEFAKEIRLAMKGDGYAGIPKARHFLAALSFSRNTRCSLSEAMSKLHPGQRCSKSVLKEFARRYRRKKRERGLVDFDDLLSFAVHLLKQHKDVRVRLRQLHRHMMIDEFQDINGLQFQIIKLLFGAPDKAGTRSLMVVGDPGQSIYGFRGARFQNWRDVLKVRGVRTINLRVNYRSSPQIVAVGNVIDDRTLTGRAEAKTPKRTPNGNKPQLALYASADDEIKHLCDLIERRVKEGVPLADQAILCRTSRHFPQIRSALKGREIASRQVGGKSTKSSNIVDNVSAVFRVAANRKDIHGLRQLLQLIPGIGAKRARSIALRATKARSRKSFHGTLRDGVASRHPNAKNLVTALKAVENDDLGVAVEDVLRAMSPFVLPRKMSLENRTELIRKLDSLQAQAAAATDLNDFVATLALEEQDQHADVSTDCLTLSTIHGAKGLEWDTVYLPRLQEGEIPHVRAQSPEEIAEERRMLYVGATRAKRRLYMSYVQPKFGGSGTSNSGPSRFLSLRGFAGTVQMKPN